MRLGAGGDIVSRARDSGGQADTGRQLRDAAAHRFF